MEYSIDNRQDLINLLSDLIPKYKVTISEIKESVSNNGEGQSTTKNQISTTIYCETMSFLLNNKWVKKYYPFNGISGYRYYYPNVDGNIDGYVNTTNTELVGRTTTYTMNLPTMKNAVSATYNYKRILSQNNSGSNFQFNNPLRIQVDLHTSAFARLSGVVGTIGTINGNKSSTSQTIETWTKYSYYVHFMQTFGFIPSFKIEER